MSGQVVQVLFFQVPPELTQACLTALKVSGLCFDWRCADSERIEQRCDLIVTYAPAERSAGWSSILQSYPGAALIALVERFEATVVLNLEDAGAFRCIPLEAVHQLGRYARMALLNRQTELFLAAAHGSASCRALLNSFEVPGGASTPAVRRSDFLATVLDTIDALLVALDSQGRIVTFNRSCERLTGYSAPEVVGKPLWDLFLVADETPGVLQVWQHLLETAQPSRHQNAWRSRQGQIYQIEWSNTVVLDEYGRVAYVIGTGIDVTGKQDSAQLQSALTRERELGELKSRFVAMTSHEFRTPLSAILSSTQLLQRYGENWPQKKAQLHLERIVRAAQRMESMLQDVLTLSGLDIGLEPAFNTWVDVTGLTRELIAALVELENNPQRIRLTCPPEPVWLCADGRLLRNVFENLLSNALKFSSADSVVEVVLSIAESKARWQVSDCGIGIPAVDLAGLFNPFQRGSNTGNIPGTGLGLAIVKKSLDRLGAGIWVESQEGQGTTFVIDLALSEIEMEGWNAEDPGD